MTGGNRPHAVVWRDHSRTTLVPLGQRSQIVYYLYHRENPGIPFQPDPSLISSPQAAHSMSSLQHRSSKYTGNPSGGTLFLLDSLPAGQVRNASSCARTHPNNRFNASIAQWTGHVYFCVSMRCANLNLVRGTIGGVDRTSHPHIRGLSP